MKRLFSRLRLVLSTLAIIGALGVFFALSEWPVLSHAPTDGAVPGEWSVGDSVALDSGVEVTLVSAENIPPQYWLERSVEAVARADRLWLAFETENTSDSTVSVPSRPWGALVFPRGRVRPGLTTAFIDGPGKGFGAGADPYLRPGDSMHTLFEFEVIDPSRPLEVSYAPLIREPVIFVLE